MSSPVYRFVRITGLGTIAAFLYGLVRSTARKPTPPAQGTASWSPLTEEPPLAPRSGPVEFTDTGAAPTDEPETAPDSEAEAAGESEPEIQGFVATAEPTSDDGADEAAAGWVEPDADGGCPGSHPIKGNDQSKIFHVPGGMSYERTKAERCYCDEASAEADGYRKAKR